MTNRRSQISLLACLASATALLASPTLVTAQSAGMPGGRVTGVVTASGAKGETIKGANVLVSLWTTGATTEAKRDSACAMWLASKTIWMQAKGEAESPSGVNWTGTAVGNDLQMLNSLLALRRDSVRTDANGAFTFASVPFGAYTVEAEMFANNKFLQWSKDAAVIPNNTTIVALDPSTLAENQYCQVSASSSSNASAGSSSDKTYEMKDLDDPVAVVSGGAESLPSGSPNSVTLSFVVDASGTPDMRSITVKSTSGTPVSDDAAHDIVKSLRFSQPKVKGTAVRARIEYTAAAPSSGGRRRG